MRISDWSSDVCSSDLLDFARHERKLWNPDLTRDPLWLALEFRDQGLRRGGVAHLGAGDEEEIDVAAARGPAARALRPMVERRAGIAGFDIALRSLEEGIGKVGGLLVAPRKFVAVGKDYRHVPLAREFDERRIAEAFVPHFERVAQRQAVLRFGQQVEESGEIVALELFRRHELPQDRAESVAEPRQPLRQKLLYRRRAIGELLAVGAETRRLAAELEAIGDRGGPIGET